MNELINMALLTLLAVDDGRHRSPAQSVRRRRTHEHLQLPDGERADCARRRRRRHDRGVGRRRHFDRPAARHPAFDQDDRNASGPHSPVADVRRARHRRGARVGTLVLPPFGAADAVIHRHVAPRYLADTIKDTGVPNVVTSVLADYRGYDTLGETTVIFTAGIGVMLLLRGARAERPTPTAGGTAHEPRSHPAHRHQADPAVHPAVCPLRSVPRRFRPGRRISGRRHCRRHGHPARLSPSVSMQRSASHRIGWSTGWSRSA